MKGRARWLVVFVLLLLAAGAIPVLADAPGEGRPPSGESAASSRTSGSTTGNLHKDAKPSAMIQPERTVVKSRPGAQGATRAVAWRAKPVEGSMILELLLSYNWCGGPDTPQVQRVEIHEEPRKTTVTAFVFFPAVRRRRSACLQTRFLEPVKISLREEASHRILYDGSGSPPTQRWPPVREAWR
jgi:hypothetical protein